MIILHGRRTARIKRFTEDQQACEECASAGLDVRVYRDYYHLYFLPILPLGTKYTEITCRRCGAPVDLKSLKREYERRSRTPLYLFTVPILLGILVLLGVYLDRQRDAMIQRLVASPLPGDVYAIRSAEGGKAAYSFLRVASVRGDTLALYHSDRVYSRFTTQLRDDDHFVKGDELLLTKAALKGMLDEGKVRSARRGYGRSEGFDKLW